MSFTLALVAAVGALLSRRKAPAKVSVQKGASRKAQAKVVAEAEPFFSNFSEQRCASQGGGGGRAICKTCALSADRGLSRLASERQPLIFGSARRQRGRGGACRDANCCGAGDSWLDEGS